MKMTSMKQKLKRYSPEEKVVILRRHLLEQVPVSELCREHDLHPNVFYRWQKEFFEGGVAAFAKGALGADQVLDEADNGARGAVGAQERGAGRGHGSLCQG